MRIFPKQCERLIVFYRKYLLQVTVAKAFMLLNYSVYLIIDLFMNVGFVGFWDEKDYYLLKSVVLPVVEKLFVC